jgi:hypothetical protein
MHTVLLWLVLQDVGPMLWIYFEQIQYFQVLLITLSFGVSVYIQLSAPCFVHANSNYHFAFHMVWYDMIWYDMIWYDMIWYEMIWYDMIYDMIWYGVVLYDIWYYIIWHNIWYDIWYDMIWFFNVMLLSMLHYKGVTLHAYMISRTSTPAQAVTVSSLWCDGRIPTAHRKSPERYRVTNFWYVTRARVPSTLSRYGVTIRGNVTSVYPPKSLK